MEQSNDLLFIVFSVLCFMKMLTVVDEMLLKNKILLNVFVMSKHIIPLIQKLFVLLFLMILFYSTVGGVLYGGLINSDSLNQYQTRFEL